MATTLDGMPPNPNQVPLILRMFLLFQRSACESPPPLLGNLTISNERALCSPALWVRVILSGVARGASARWSVVFEEMVHTHGN